MKENKKIIIYTSSLCGFCYKAKSLLNRYNIDYNEVNIDIDDKKREEMVLKTKGKTSVPQIFIGFQHIGGCDDLYELEKNNKLEIFNN
ncbi:glutaredoxin 3 [Alphaproteobacteria bacterium]|nr:glutaredoxin 3 [Alphaproteobacteria bacterium]